MLNFDTEQVQLLRIIPRKMRMDTYPTEHRPSGGFSVSAQAQTGVNFERRLIRISLSVQILPDTQQPAEVYVKGVYEYDFVFQVKQFDGILEPLSPSGKLDRMLTSSLITLSFSTLRGILYVHFAGTPLDGFLLPAVHPSRLMPRDSQL